MLALSLTQTPGNTRPWEGQSTGPSDLAELEKAARLRPEKQGALVWQKLSLQPFPSFLGLGPAPFPLTLEVLGGGEGQLGHVWLPGEDGQAGKPGKGLLQWSPTSPLNTPSMHTHLVGEGEGKPGTHVHPAPSHHTHTATPSTRDTLTHSPFTHPAHTRVHTHTHPLLPSPLPLTRVQTQAL